jgi:putative ABC transport system substrate-binding protein
MLQTFLGNIMLSRIDVDYSRRAQAITAAAHPVIDTNGKRKVDFAAKNRVPAIYTNSEFVNAGGLMFYGVSFSDLYSRAAVYVDKILKGRKPADLPSAAIYDFNHKS